MDRPIAGVEELMDQDMGMGPYHPEYVDIVLPTDAPDLVDFNVALTLADNVKNLGLGQNEAPEVVAWDLEESETQEDLDDVGEENFQ